MVRRSRSGKSSYGCLVFILFVGAVLYFGFNIGNVYWRAYQFQDAMTQESRFAARNGERVIVAHLRAQVDSLGLPEGAKTNSDSPQAEPDLDLERVHRDRAASVEGAGDQLQSARGEGLLSVRVPARKVMSLERRGALARGTSGARWCSPTASSISCTSATSICSRPRASSATAHRRSQLRCIRAAAQGPVAPRAQRGRARVRRRRARDGRRRHRVRAGHAARAGAGAAPRRAREGRRLHAWTRSSGAREVESWGGRVHVIPLTAGHSTTRIIEALRAGS